VYMSTKKSSATTAPSKISMQYLSMSKQKLFKSLPRVVIIDVNVSGSALVPLYRAL